MLLSRYSPRALLLLALSGLTGLPGARASAQSPCQFELREVVAYQLPESFTIGRLDASDSDAIVLGSAIGPGILVIRNDTIQPLNSAILQQPVGVAVLARGATLEVLDRGLQAVVRFPGHQKFGMDEVDRTIPTGTTQAVRTDSGWISVAPSRGGGTSVSFIRSRGTEPIATVFPTYDAFTRELAVLLTPAPNGVIVAQRFPPFEVLVVSATGVVRSIPVAFRMPQGYSGARQGQRLMALPVLQIAECFIQVIVDAAGDARILRVFNKNGKLLRNAPFRLPVNLLAVSSDSRSVIATRELTTREIVAYRWHRGAGAPIGGEPLKKRR